MEKTINILAEAQKKMLETENLETRARLEAEFNELYFKTREKDENSFLGKLSLKTRHSLHWFVISVFKIKIPDKEKMDQETASLDHINDSFKKIIIVGDIIKPWINEKGYLIMSIYDFLLKLDSLEM